MAEEELINLLTPCKSLVAKLHATNLQYRLNNNEVDLLRNFRRAWKSGLHFGDPRLQAAGMSDEELSTLVGMFYNPPLYFYLINQYND